MNEFDNELPEMNMPLKIKTLKDRTNIFTCNLPKINKIALVIDIGVDTVLFFHFSSIKEILKALFITASTSEEYLDKLFIKYPNLKAWIPSLPYGERGDIINIRLMNNQEYCTDSISWLRNYDFTYSIKIFDDMNPIKLEDIRYIHIYCSSETFETYHLLEELNSKDLDAMKLVFYMCQLHLENYNKRLILKQINLQNNNH